MRSPIPDYLTEALDGVRPDTSGALAQYIPELAAAPPERLAAVFATVDGEIYGAGDADTEFTIQSISKPFAYALALTDRGLDAVLARVGVEPSGEAFNEISLDRLRAPAQPDDQRRSHRHPRPGRGRGMTRSERTQRVVDGLSAFAGRRLEAGRVRVHLGAETTRTATSPSATCCAATASSRRSREQSSPATPVSARCSSPRVTWR